MNIVLIRPATPKKCVSLSDVYITEPFELEYLYSVLEKDHNVIIVDFQIVKTPVEKIIEDLKKVDIVCFSGYVIHVDIIKGLAEKIKRISPKTHILVGGIHAEWCPEDFETPFIDIVVKRFALVSFNKVISLIGEGKIDEVRKYDFNLPEKKTDALN